MDLWDRFSSNLREVVTYANERAQAGGLQINAAQVVLGIIRVGEGKAAQRLQTVPDLPSLITELERQATLAPPAEKDNVTFTPEVQRALTRAYMLAKDEESHEVETRHLLAGLLQEAEIAQTLREAGLNEE
jgi:ATP-dependent Clp protease ATP-binding subunit ClpA